MSEIVGDSLDNLSNAELRKKCIEFGLPNVPVTDSSRKILVKKLRASLAGGGGGGSSSGASTSSPATQKKSSRRETIQVPVTKPTTPVAVAVTVTSSNEAAATSRANRRTIATAGQQLVKESPKPASASGRTTPKPERAAQKITVRAREEPVIIIEDDYEDDLVMAAVQAENTNVTETTGSNQQPPPPRRNSRASSLSKTGVLTTSYTQDMQTIQEQDGKMVVDAGGNQYTATAKFAATAPSTYTNLFNAVNVPSKPQPLTSTRYVPHTQPIGFQNIGLEALGARYSPSRSLGMRDAPIEAPTRTIGARDSPIEPPARTIGARDAPIESQTRAAGMRDVPYELPSRPLGMPFEAPSSRRTLAPAPPIRSTLGYTNYNPQSVAPATYQSSNVLRRTINTTTAVGSPVVGTQRRTTAYYNEASDDTDNNEDDGIFKTPYVSNYARNLELTKGGRSSIVGGAAGIGRYQRQQRAYPAGSNSDSPSATLRQLLGTLDRKYNLKRYFTCFLILIVIVFIYVMFF